MTDEEAHVAFHTRQKVLKDGHVQAGCIIMIGYKRDETTIITCVQDDRGEVFAALPEELQLLQDPNAETSRAN